MDPRPFSSRGNLRAWFAKHAATEPELWILFYKVHTGRPTVTYAEALDEALCVGWIDGKVKRIDDESHMQRFTPRRPDSYWSSVNIRKAKALIAAGRLTPAGLVAFERRGKSASERRHFESLPTNLPRGALAKLRKNRKAWQFWKEQPPGYRRISTSYVLSAKRPETRARRLETVIAYCARGMRLPLLTSPGKDVKATKSKTRDV